MSRDGGRDGRRDGGRDARRRAAGAEAVDWAQAHARLEDVARATAGAGALDAEQAAAVLRERARALARRPAAGGATDALEVLRCTLGGRACAVESRHLHAVLCEVTVTPLPGAAAPVHALVPWRGRILTALRLHEALGIADAGGDAAAGTAPHLLVLGDEEPELGLLVDAVHELAPLDPARLHPLPAGAAARREYVVGLTDEALLLLDGAAVLRLHAADA